MGIAQPPIGRSAYRISTDPGGDQQHPTSSCATRTSDRDRSEHQPCADRPGSTTRGRGAERPGTRQLRTFAGDQSIPTSDRRTRGDTQSNDRVATAHCHAAWRHSNRSTVVPGGTLLMPVTRSSRTSPAVHNMPGFFLAQGWLMSGRLPISDITIRLEGRSHVRANRPVSHSVARAESQNASPE